MSNIDILILVVGGLWLYGRCCQAIFARHYEEYLDGTELRYSDKSIGAGNTAGGANLQ